MPFDHGSKLKQWKNYHLAKFGIPVIGEECSPRIPRWMSDRGRRVGGGRPQRVARIRWVRRHVRGNFPATCRLREEATRVDLGARRAGRIRVQHDNPDSYYLSDAAEKISMRAPSHERKALYLARFWRGHPAVVR